MSTSRLQVGQKVRIHQEIDRREGNWVHQVEGEIIDLGAEKQGSWFAHGKDRKLWLNRIRLRKADGEITTIGIDRFTRVEVLADAAQPSA